MTPDRLWQLLADEASEGLGPDTAAELSRLLDQHPEVDRDGLALAAAALDRALYPDTSEALPAGLAARITLHGRALIQGHDAPDVRPLALAPATSTAPNGSERTDAAPPRSGFGSGWLMAAAAVLIAAFVWWSEPGSEPRTSPSPQSADRTTSLAALRASLQGAPDAVSVAWAPPEDPRFAAVRGDVVWSSARQAGVMSFEGLPVNDPAVAQYQLWIVDPARDTRPVDGGVFDVTDAGPQLVPIDAKLAVGEPTLFAVTLEQPGGVVVSAGPLLIVAPVEG